MQEPRKYHTFLDTFSSLHCNYTRNDTLQELNLLSRKDELKIFPLAGKQENISSISKRIDEAWVVSTQDEEWGETISNLVATKGVSEFALSPDGKKAAIVVWENEARNISVIPFDIKGIKLQ